ncbi:MAG: GTP 3',8-cyclase MoaA [bacterium]|nr:GTP 3',8-cyclase MoaA [bacterium]
MLDVTRTDPSARRSEPAHGTAVADRLRRPLHDLRISVTDRCNFRCTYCMPRDVFGADYPFLPRDEILSFEEIGRLAALFGQLGARKFRVTGGEPLLRKGLDRLISILAAIDGADVALTTNGVLLPNQAAALAAAGLRRVTISLDSLEDGVHREMGDTTAPVESVLAGISAAEKAGLSPVKINTVVRRGCNEDAILDLVRHFRGSGHIVRFIEFMDVGMTNGWSLDEVVPADEILERIGEVYPVEPMGPNYPGEVARRYRLLDGSGELGIVASVTHPFCGGCTRARLSTDGQLFTCLFSSEGLDLRAPLRAGAGDDELLAIIGGRWQSRNDRYSEQRSQATLAPAKIEMSYIGG